jgi:methionine-rich copper-binding protein CopC
MRQFVAWRHAGTTPTIRHNCKALTATGRQRPDQRATDLFTLKDDFMQLPSKHALNALAAATVAVFAIVAAPVARAHTHLESSTPANHAVLDKAPADVALEFAEPVALVSARLDAGDGAGTALKVSEEHAARQKIALPALKAGSYRLEWRAQGHDGHVVSGEVSFQVKAAGTK